MEWSVLPWCMRILPQDLGHDVGRASQPYSGVLAVPMTTVRQDAAELGRLAVEMLCRRIASPAAEPPASVVVPTSLVPRSSVATLRHR